MFNNTRPTEGAQSTAMTEETTPLSSLQYLARNPETIPIQRDDRGMMNVICTFCGAYMWLEERESRSSMSSPKFQMCCSKGESTIENLRPTPAPIATLLTGTDEQSKEFRNNIRSYNSALSFSSMGVKLDHGLANMNTGNYTFRIQGSPYHLIGSAMPVQGDQPKFAQIYFYDVEHELDNRARIFPDMNRATLAGLQTMMHTVNPFVAHFKMMKEVAQSIRRERNANNDGSNDNGIDILDNVKLVFRAEGAPDKRRYNRPTTSTDVGAVIVGGEGDVDNAIASKRDIVVHMKGNNRLSHISELNQFYDPLHYVLIHPYGDAGWNIKAMTSHDLTELNLDNNVMIAAAITNSSNRQPSKVTPMQFYSFRMMFRPQTGNLLHLCGKLFHQYAVDMFCKMETERLFHQFKRSEDMRVEKRNEIGDAIHMNDLRNMAEASEDQNTTGNHMNKVGLKVILSSSFIGGPRHMAQNYYDAMSIVRRHGKPDLFITFTCNPFWPEIQRQLLSNQSASERPDLCARVFNMKLKELLNDILKKNVLGRTVAYVYTIEFQKRGLPHAHMLCILHPDDKPTSIQDIDNLVSAEIPDPELHPLAYTTVTKHMMHGPCGVINPTAVCMDSSSKCSKGFPKRFSNETTPNASGGYPIYKRPENSRTVPKLITQNGHRATVNMDNRWVVPHNLYLCTKFDAHINVEICGSINAIKYVFKYVYKGHDRASITVEEENEIKKYLDSRYVSAPEAFWRLFSFKIHKEFPAHVRLDVHLEGEDNIYMKSGDTPESLRDRIANHQTTLTAWFKMNRENEYARTILYPNFPEHFTWVVSPQPKKWKLREGSHGKTIGRIYNVSPKQGELYYLRMLLYHIPGATCFEDMRTVNSQVYLTFQAAAEALGLLESDNQWEHCLDDAVAISSARQLRNLFSVILVFCSPSNPYDLFLKYKDNLSEDFLYRLRNNPMVDHVLDDIQRIAYDHCILELNDQLADEFDFDLSTQRGFLIPATDTRENVEQSDVPRLIRQHQRLVTNAIERPDDVNISAFNTDQRHVYDAVIEASLGSDESCPATGKVFFVDGPGGTGKTFLFNALLLTIRRRGDIALAVASSGTASLLLDGGRTSHSLFKIPLQVDETTVCKIKPGSDIATLLQLAKVVIWDEASMTSRHIFEAVDRTLKDVFGVIDPKFERIPFGGRLFVFGGDFRQTLPVIPDGRRSDIIGQCINRSVIWQSVVTFRLQVNMRVQQALTENNDSLAQQLSRFSEFLLSVGNGTIDELEYTLENGTHISTDYISISNDMIIRGDNLITLLREIYPRLYQPVPDTDATALIDSTVTRKKKLRAGAVLVVHGGAVVGFLDGR
jgi:hypothetical protein